MTEQVPHHAPKRVPVVVPVRPNYHTAYLRSTDIRTLLHKLPEVTIAYTVDAERNIVLGAISYFNPHDKSFCKKLGRKFAFERLDELVANENLATPESRFYFVITMADINAGIMAHIDSKFLRSAAVTSAMAEAVSSAKITDVLHNFVWRKVVMTALDVMQRPRQYFRLDSTTADELLAKTETAAEAGEIPVLMVENPETV